MELGPVLRRVGQRTPCARPRAPQWAGARWLCGAVAPPHALPASLLVMIASPKQLTLIMHARLAYCLASAPWARALNKNRCLAGVLLGPPWLALERSKPTGRPKARQGVRVPAPFWGLRQRHAPCGSCWHVVAVRVRVAWLWRVCGVCGCAGLARGRWAVVGRVCTVHPTSIPRPAHRYTVMSATRIEVRDPLL